MAKVKVVYNGWGRKSPKPGEFIQRPDGTVEVSWATWKQYKKELSNA